MRLWSIHPSYLDTKGLLAVWREGLLALHVLRGQTKGYVHHPQLIRFRSHPEPIVAISEYLHTVVDEAEKRHYSFKREKLEPREIVKQIPVRIGQLEFETGHLRKKLAVRDPEKHQQLLSIIQFELHPLFTLTEGGIESWEKNTTV